jgi:hypothetical protein
MAFFNLPLAWLWVKSWDIGFAFVMIFDKVIWELFPHSDLPLVIDEGVGVNTDTEPQEVAGTIQRLVEKTDLDNILKHSLQVDPTYNIHAYYFLLSIALLSVPALTGYATLKARKGVLSSFVNGPNTLAGDAASKASNAYSAALMNKKVAEMRTQAAHGKVATGFRGSGLGGNGRHESALRWAGMAAGSEVATSLAGKGLDGISKDVRDSRGNKTGEKRLSKGGAAKELAGGMKKGMDAYMQVLAAEVKHDGEYAGAFHKEYGRWSLRGKMADAQAAAIDGGGGYEINDPGINADSQLVGTFKAKVGASMDAVNRAATRTVPGVKQWKDPTAIGGGLANGGSVLLGLMMGDDNTALPKRFSDENQGAKVIDEVSGRTYLEKTFNFKDKNGEFQRAYDQVPVPPQPKDVDPLKR